MKAEPDFSASSEARFAGAKDGLHLALSIGRVGAWELHLNRPASLHLSAEFCQLLGFKGDEYDGAIKSFLARVSSLDRFRVVSRVRRAIQRGGDLELEFRLEAGERRGWLLCRSRIETGAEGQPVKVVGVGIDVTEQKEAELELRRLNSELKLRVRSRSLQLEKIDKELEAFCYSISHDLRAPLRSIRGFSEVLLERYGSMLDERGQEFLRRTCHAGQHMDEMLESLLKLSRIGRAELLDQKVDLSGIAKELGAELSASEPQRKVEFQIGAGLSVRGDERSLKIVLENLIRNSWTFTSKRPRAHIEIGRVPGEESAFFVRDNGIGFDPAYTDRLFGVFQRLHSSAEYPGTGLGLATVRRIIHRHGGRVWAEGAVDEGATFFFSLPPHETV